MTFDDLKRMTVFATDIPFPANKGGRADIWRRLQALSGFGIQVQLVCFFDDVEGLRPTPEHLDEVRRHTAMVHAYPLRKGLLPTIRRLTRLGAMPWHAASRALGTAAAASLTLQVQQFGSQLLWCEGPWSGALATHIAQSLRLPIAYRSHNIEHRYMARQAAAARRTRDRLAWSVACWGLERFEDQLIRSADWVFDISCDDMAFWQAQGLQDISWLPPLAESALSLGKASTGQAPSHDVVFLGNLTTPNNVRGIEWLLQEIQPRVLARRPGTGFVVAGSNPGPHVRQLCASTGTQLMANVPDALALYRSARVLVNPVRTGSGTHVKAIEMLMMSAPIVTATQGTMGMPPEVKGLFRVADTAEAFADQVTDALTNPTDEWAARAHARRLFGVEGLGEAMAQLQQRLQSRGRLAATSAVSVR